MPFLSETVYKGTNGTKSVSVSFVIHISGSTGKEKSRGYGVEGKDSRKPKVTYLPPSCNTKEEAMQLAVEYLGEIS